MSVFDVKPDALAVDRLQARVERLERAVAELADGFDPPAIAEICADVRARALGPADERRPKAHPAGLGLVSLGVGRGAAFSPLETEKPE